MLPDQITRWAVLCTNRYSTPRWHSLGFWYLITFFWVNFLFQLLTEKVLTIGSFESSMVCYIPWSGAPWPDIRSMERNGMAGKRSIYWFQVVFTSCHPCGCALIFSLVHHFMVSLIQLFLDILNAQRSWIHFFGESVVLCKDVLSKLLTWLFSKQEIQTYDLPAKTLSNSF